MHSLLEVRGVSVSFDGYKAINELSFEIGKRELRAIIGPNGAGKTTFMDLITGKTKPDIGSVQWGTPPQNLLKMSESKIASLGIGRKFQRPTVFENQSVLNNLLISLKKKRDPISSIFFRLDSIDHQRIDEIAVEIGLNEYKNKIAGELSHGQKQWLEIGMLLAQGPKLLLIDEPAAGMTPSERKHTTDLIKRTAGNHAVVVVEHDMQFVRRLDCRVTVLHEGSVLSEGSYEYVTKNKDVINVYLGR